MASEVNQFVTSDTLRTKKTSGECEHRLNGVRLQSYCPGVRSQSHLLWTYALDVCPLTLGTFRALPYLCLSSRQYLKSADLGLHPGSAITVTLAAPEYS